MSASVDVAARKAAERQLSSPWRNVANTEMTGSANDRRGRARKPGRPNRQDVVGASGPLRPVRRTGVSRGELPGRTIEKRARPIVVIDGSSSAGAGDQQSVALGPDFEFDLEEGPHFDPRAPGVGGDGSIDQGHGRQTSVGKRYDADVQPHARKPNLHKRFVRGSRFDGDGPFSLNLTSDPAAGAPLTILGE